MERSDRQRKSMYFSREHGCVDPYLAALHTSALVQNRVNSSRLLVKAHQIARWKFRPELEFHAVTSFQAVVPACTAHYISARFTCSIVFMNLSAWNMFCLTYSLRRTYDIPESWYHLCVNVHILMPGFRCCCCCSFICSKAQNKHEGKEVFTRHYIREHSSIYVF